MSHDPVDVTVIGTGAGGAPVLARLAAAGLKVVALEAGEAHPPGSIATDERAMNNLFWRDERLSAGRDPLAFGSNNSGCGVGGSTLHFTAYTPRPQPDDLTLHTEFGVGQDWPLAFAELEPYLDEVEHFIGVSGPDPYPWGPARRRPYRHPALPLNSAATLMQRGCEALGLGSSPAANAALSRPQAQEGVGTRPACSNRGYCQVGCSVGAKASLDQTYLALARARGAEIRPRAFVTGFETRAGRITAVLYTRDGQSERQETGAVYLCAGAIETPRLLLLGGLAGGSGQVGQNFMAHVGVQLWGSFEAQTRPWKGIPGGLISEDTHRLPGLVGGYLLQSIGVMPVTYAQQYARGIGTWGAALHDHLHQYAHVAGINVLGECLPSAENYLELSDETDARGLPKPKVHFSFGDNERRMTDHAEALMRELWTAAGAQDLWAFPRAAHTIGTARMGSDPESSVVNPWGQSWEVPNLYISDNSTFPSALSANPALTLMALGLRSADHFLERARTEGHA